MSEILSVGILPCMKMPVRSSCTWKPTYTLALHTRGGVGQESARGQAQGHAQAVPAPGATPARPPGWVPPLPPPLSLLRSPVDGGAPPQREAAVGDLVQARALRIGKLLVLHRLLKPAGLLPEQPLPGGEVGTLEERVLQDAFHAAQRLRERGGGGASRGRGGARGQRLTVCTTQQQAGGGGCAHLDHVRAVVVQVPQLAVVALVRPPEGVDLQRARGGGHRRVGGFAGPRGAGANTRVRQLRPARVPLPPDSSPCLPWARCRP